MNEKSTTDIEDMIFEASKQIEFLLQKKNPEEIYNYFEKNKIYDFKENKPNGKKLFDKLFKSKNTIIKLSLAEYYPSKEVKEEIFFSTQNEAIRLACLRHKNITKLLFTNFYEEVPKSRMKFIFSASENELHSYFTHRFFYFFDIQDFVEQKSLYKELEEKKYNQILEIIRYNPNLSKRPEPTDNELFMIDGWSYYNCRRAYDNFFEKFNKIKK
jgi:hypothetical protein